MRIAVSHWMEAGMITPSRSLLAVRFLSIEGGLAEQDDWALRSLIIGKVRYANRGSPASLHHPAPKRWKKLNTPVLLLICMQMYCEFGRVELLCWGLPLFQD
jgi:hypothetical protein